MVKNARGWAASAASFSPRSSTRTARIGPSGGAASPNRLRSALLNGRSHAKALPPTDHDRLPRLLPSVTSGNSAAIVATSSKVSTRSDAGVGVEADQPDVDDQVVEQERGVAQQRDVGGPATLPARRRPGVQVRGVDH